jgi:hypothetical protein
MTAERRASCTEETRLACRARPRIAFGTIVLNGEPFTRYNLRSIYPWAYQIIVVEGACRAAAGVADSTGHSRDGTLEVLRRFQAEEDPERKLVIVTAEDEGHPDGFWPGEKHEMSQAYAKRATGDWLWQVDVDEFYLPHDMERILGILQRPCAPTAVSFEVRTFTASPTHLVDGYQLRSGANVFRRLFAWGPGYRYTTHRPPTVVDERGRDLASLNPLPARALARQGIFMYHYEQLFPKQVLEKCAYYARAQWAGGMAGMDAWARDCYMRLGRPYRVHMLHRAPSWLDRYKGPVPSEVERLVAAVRQGQHPGVQVRAPDELDLLLGSARYAIGRGVLKAWFPLWLGWRKPRLLLGRLKHALFPKWPGPAATAHEP